MLMTIALVASGVSISAIVVYAFSFGFVRLYIERGASMSVVAAVSIAISISLFSVFLIPMDIFVISGNLNANNMQKDPSMTHNTSNGIGYLYYTFYFLFSIFIAFILPFTYFYIEEDYGAMYNRARVLTSLKYTMISFGIFIVLMIIGFVLKKNQGKQSEDWMHDISMTYSNTDAMLAFAIGFFAVVGLFGWITYTAYGMAALPIELYRDKIEVKPYSRLSMDTDLKEKLNKNNDAFIEEANPRMPNRGRIPQQSKTEKNPPEKSCASCCIFRRAFGIFGLFLGGMVIVSLLLSTIEKFLYSKCKYSCSFSAPIGSIINPLDIILSITSRLFPLDFVLFAMIVIYIFMCTIYGMASLGVRFGCIYLYKLARRNTLSNAMVMGSGLIMMNVLVLNIQLTTISPHYMHFGGNQHYYPLNSTNVTYPAVAQKCKLMDSLKIVGHDQCIQSQISTFVDKLNVQLPFFGVILLFSNAVFLAAYAFWTLVLIFQCYTPSSKKDDLWDDDL